MKKIYKEGVFPVRKDQISVKLLICTCNFSCNFEQTVYIEIYTNINYSWYIELINSTDA